MKLHPRGRLNELIISWVSPTWPPPMKLSEACIKIALVASIASHFFYYGSCTSMMVEDENEVTEDMILLIASRSNTISDSEISLLDTVHFSDSVIHEFEGKGHFLMVPYTFLIFYQ